MSKGINNGKICIKCKLRSTDENKFYLGSGNFKIIDNVSLEMIRECESFVAKSDICLDCLKKSSFPYYDFTKLVNIRKKENAKIESILYEGYNSKEEYQKQKKIEIDYKKNFNVGFIIIVIATMIIYKLLN